MSDQHDEDVIPGLGGANPELYARLSEPYPNRAAGDEALNRFLLEVQKLREECGIPEALVIAGTHFNGDEKENVTIKALAMGHSDFRAQLGALAYQQYTLPEIERAERLSRIALGQALSPQASKDRK